MITSELVHFCAQQVLHQQRGPIQVAWMVDACVYGMQYFKQFSPENCSYALKVIKQLGYLVERYDNDPNHFRKSDVFIATSNRQPPKCQEVPSLMSRWAMNLKSMTPEEAYYEFEMIHPFVDGNGRVGDIIFNSLKKTWDNPIKPPNFWSTHESA